MTIQSSWNPLPYNYVFLRRLGSLNRCNSDLLTLPTIRFLALLKHVDCSSAINHPSFNSDQFDCLNMTLVFEFLDRISLIQRFLYLGLCFSQQSIVYYQLHCDSGWSLSLNSNLSISPSQARASSTPTILN